MSNQPTASFHTIYAETVAEQIMIAAIQVPTHIQTPSKKSATQMLTSYSNNHQDSILQCAAYGFWAKNKKNALLIQITDADECIIQNPENTDQIARSYNPYITKSNYPIASNSRINSDIETHLGYLSLLTQVENISILQIPASKLFDQAIIDTIYEYSNTETIVIYLSNYNPNQKEHKINDALIHALRQHINKNQEPETLQYKNSSSPLHKARHHLHQAI